MPRTLRTLSISLAPLLMLLFALYGVARPAAAVAQMTRESPIPTGLHITSAAAPAPSYFVFGTNNSTRDDDGALWQSYDGGASWQALSIPSSFNPVRDVFFVDDQHGWAAGNENFRTTDGGSTWHQLPFIGSTFAMRFFTVDFGVASTNGGLMVSRDGGLSWDPSPDDLFDFDFTDGVNGMGVSSSGIYRTSDGGASFSKVRSGDASDVVFLTATDALAIVDDAFVRSTDGGRSWDTVAPANGRNRLVHLSADVVLAWGYTATIPNTDGRLLRSADGGRTWTDLGVPFDVSGHFAALDASTVVANDTGGDVYRSSDGGQTWTLTYDAPYVGPGVSLVFAGSATGLLAYGNGLIVKTTDGGQTWTQISSGYGAELLDLDRFGDGRLIAIGRDGTVLHNDGASEQWLRGTFDLNVAFAAVDVVDDRFVAAGGGNGLIFTSADGGHTWTDVRMPLFAQSFDVGDVLFRSHTEGWVVGRDLEPPYDRTVYHTTDGGQTWTKPIRPGGVLSGIDFEGDSGWIVGGSRVLHTDDGGITWSTVTLPDDGTGVSVLDVEFSDTSNGYVVGERGYAARSSDGGQTWTLLDTGTSASLTDLYLTSTDEAWASSNGDAVLHTADGGQTFEVLPIHSDALSFGAFQAIAASPEGRLWTVGTGGYIYSSTTGTTQPAPPAAPTGLTATPASSTTIDLVWTDNAGNEDGFQVERSSGSEPFAQVAAVGADVTTYSDTGLTASTTYAYRVRAVNAAGASGYSNTASATTPSATKATMHVTSVVTSTQHARHGQSFGTAQVVVADAGGDPVAGATVTGTFSGDFNETTSGVTDGSGTATLTTGTAVRKPVFDFCVAGVTKSGFTFDAAASTGTCSGVGKAGALSLGQEGDGVPDEITLAQNYPNPFNPSTEISFALPEAVRVRLTVYDVLGREVARLVDGSLSAGRHQVRFDASALPSGTYLYRLEAGATVLVQHMTLLR